MGGSSSKFDVPHVADRPKKNKRGSSDHGDASHIAKSADANNVTNDAHQPTDHKSKNGDVSADHPPPISPQGSGKAKKNSNPIAWVQRRLSKKRSTEDEPKQKEADKTDAVSGDKPETVAEEKPDVVPEDKCEDKPEAGDQVTSVAENLVEDVLSSVTEPQETPSETAPELDSSTVHSDQPEIEKQEVEQQQEQPQEEEEEALVEVDRTNSEEVPNRDTEDVSDDTGVCIAVSRHFEVDANDVSHDDDPISSKICNGDSTEKLAKLNATSENEISTKEQPNVNGSVEA